jgi:hypothetical protein
MLQSKLKVGVLAILAVFVSLGAQSPQKADAYQTFNDDSQWQAALDKPTTTFSFPDGRISTGTVFSNGLSVNFNDFTQPGRIGFVGDAKGTLLTFNRQAGGVNILLDINLPSPVQAFALNLSSHWETSEFPPGSRNFVISIPESNGTNLNLTSRGDQSFFGFISDPGTSIKDINITLTQRTGLDYVQVDKITVPNQATTVPESSSILGLVISSFLGGIALQNREKSRALSAQTIRVRK